MPRSRAWPTSKSNSVNPTSTHDRGRQEVRALFLPLGLVRRAAQRHGRLAIQGPLPEQRAVATVLADTGAELAGLEQRRDKTRALGVSA